MCPTPIRFWGDFLLHPHLYGKKILHVWAPNGTIHVGSSFTDEIDIPKINTVLKLLQTISVT
jgi:hypothetical protein